METSKPIVSRHCKSFKTNRKRDFSGFLMSTIQKPKFRKTCSAMAAKILDRKSAKLPAQA